MLNSQYLYVLTQNNTTRLHSLFGKMFLFKNKIFKMFQFLLKYIIQCIRSFLIFMTSTAFKSLFGSYKNNALRAESCTSQLHQKIHESYLQVTKIFFF